MRPPTLACSLVVAACLLWNPGPTRAQPSSGPDGDEVPTAQEAAALDQEMAPRHATALHLEPRRPVAGPVTLMVVGFASSVLTTVGWAIYDLNHSCPIHLDLWGTSDPPECEESGGDMLPFFASAASIGFTLGIVGMAWLIAGKRQARRLAGLRPTFHF